MFDPRHVRPPAALDEHRTHPSDFLSVREFVPGQGSADWDGLNTPPPGTGVLWVDVDLDRADLRSLEQLLPRLCPGFPVSRITEFFMVGIEAAFDDLPHRVVPDVSVVRSFDWLVTAWHHGEGHGETHRIVEQRWEEIGAAGAMTARDLAALFLEEVSDQRGSVCQLN